MTSLSEIVEVVIGVDTHVRTHSAAAVDARTGGVLGELTVEATATPRGPVIVRLQDRHRTIPREAAEQIRVRPL